MFICHFLLQCELEFWEEQFIESCFEEMFQEEQNQASQPSVGQGYQIQGQGRSIFIPPQQNAPGPNGSTPNNNSQPSSHEAPKEGSDLAGMMQGLNIEEHNQKNTVRFPQSCSTGNRQIFCFGIKYKLCNEKEGKKCVGFCHL
jgi:hypothetical protein